MLLTLPTLDPAIPARIDFVGSDTVNARLAAAMSDARMFSKADLDALSVESLGSVTLRNLVAEPWRREFAPRFKFDILSAHASFELLAVSDHVHQIERTRVAAFGVEAGQAEAIFLEPACRAADEVHPGLGMAVVMSLDHALDCFGLPFSPSGAFDMAQWHYWQGESDEVAALEIYKEEYGEDDVDIPAKADLFDGIPEPVWNCAERKPFQAIRDRIAQYAAQFADTPVGPLLGKIAELDAVLKRTRKRALPKSDYGDRFNSLVCLVWDEATEGQLWRVFDDHYQYVMEGGEDAPYLVGQRVGDTKKEISDLRSRARNTCDRLQALDAALVEVRKFQS